MRRFDAPPARLRRFRRVNPRLPRRYNPAWSHGVQEWAGPMHSNLVPSLQIAYVWQASVFTREVLDGLVRIGFLYPQQIIWDKGRTVLTRTHYWYGLPVLQDECTGRCQRLRVLRAGDQ